MTEDAPARKRTKRGEGLKFGGVKGIDALTAKEKELKRYRDSMGTGLILTVRGGSEGVGKYWTYDYSINGKRKSLSIGKYPLVGLSDARKAVEEAKVLLAKGIDPSQEKQNRKKQAQAQAEAEKQEKLAQAQTVSKTVDDWIRLHSTKIRASTLKRYEGVIAKYILPKIGDRPVASVKQADLLKIVRGLEDSQIYRTARMTCNLLKCIFCHAYIMQWIESDPSVHLQKLMVKRPDVEHYEAVTDVARLSEILKGVWEYRESNPNFYSHAGLSCSLLLMLLPLRMSEATGLLWTDIDFEKRTILIPQEREGHKVKISLTLPMTKQIEFLLKEREKVRYGNFVFGGKDARNHVSRSGIRSALKTLGIDENEQAIHGWRSSFQTLTVSAGATGDISYLVNRCLGHKTGAIDSCYLRCAPIDGMRALLQWWNDSIDSMAQGNGLLKMPIEKILDGTYGSNDA